jgi:hypothetical protein
VSRTKPIDELSGSQVLALSRYATQRGRGWKAQLLAAWESSGTDAPNYTPELQQIRNHHGPELVTKVRTREVLEAGAQVAAARSEPDSPTESPSVGPSR